MTDARAAPRRHYPVAVNVEALALAWARQDSAPAGAVVVTDHEISPRGRLGRLWAQTSDRTATLAMVWRPHLPSDTADLIWSAASLGVLRAIEHLTDFEPRLVWPDGIVDHAGALMGAVKAEIQLGRGGVTSAIVTARVDLDMLNDPARAHVLSALEAGLAETAAKLDAEPERSLAAYNDCSALIGFPVVIRTLPRGQIRGTIEGVDAKGALQIVSITGLRQRVPIVVFDQLMIQPTSGC